VRLKKGFAMKVSYLKLIEPFPAKGRAFLCRFAELPREMEAGIRYFVIEVRMYGRK